MDLWMIVGVLSILLQHILASLPIPSSKGNEDEDKKPKKTFVVARVYSSEDLQFEMEKQNTTGTSPYTEGETLNVPDGILDILNQVKDGDEGPHTEGEPLNVPDGILDILNQVKDGDEGSNDKSNENQISVQTTPMVTTSTDTTRPTTHTEGKSPTTNFNTFLGQQSKSPDNNFNESNDEKKVKCNCNEKFEGIIFIQRYFFIF